MLVNNYVIEYSTMWTYVLSWINSVRGLSAHSVQYRSLSKKSEQMQRERPVDAKCTQSLLCVDAAWTQSEYRVSAQQTFSSFSVNTNRTTTGRRLDANQTQWNRWPVSESKADPGSFSVTCTMSGLRSVCVQSAFSLRPVVVLFVSTESGEGLLPYVLCSLCVHAASTQSKVGLHFERSRCVCLLFRKWATMNAACTQSTNWLQATEDIRPHCSEEISQFCEFCDLCHQNLPMNHTKKLAKSSTSWYPDHHWPQFSKLNDS